MRILLAVLTLALAALAIPPADAALPVQCSAGPTAPGGDTHCEGTVAGCDVLVHAYDQEDALNRYKAACGCVAYDNYGRPALRFDCYTPPPVAGSSAASAPDLVETHCVADETGAAYCSTTVVGTCTVTSAAGTPSSASCDLPVDSAAMALPVTCSLGPMTPGGDTDCRATAAGCYAHTHLYDVEDALNVYEVSCYDCGVHVGAGGVRCDLIAVEEPTPLAASAAEIDAEPCQTGIAQTWCDATVGPCDVRATPWTAWGDVYAWADCRGGSMTRCYTEVHTQDPANPEHWCAF